MREMRNLYKGLVGKSEGKKWKVDIKMS